MNTTRQMSAARPEERLCELVREFSGPAMSGLEARLERLKSRLLKRIVKKVADSALLAQVTAAANEAARQAWYTGYPILLFPALLEEKLARLLQPITTGSLKSNMNLQPDF